MYKIILSLLILAQLAHAQSKITGTLKDLHYTSIIISPLFNTKIIDVKKEFNPKNGTFYFEFPTTQNAFYKLNYKDKYLWLYIAPGSNTILNLDYYHWEDTTRFSGDFIVENNYLNHKSRALLNSKSSKDQFTEAAKNGKTVFLKEVETQKENQMNKFYAEIQTLQLDKLFALDYAKNYIELPSYQIKLLFPAFAKINEDTFYAENKEYLQFMNNIPQAKEYQSLPNYLDLHLLYYKILTGLDHYKYQSVDTIDEKGYYKTLINSVQNYPFASLKPTLQEALIGEYLAYYGLPLDIKEQIAAYTNSLSDQDKATKFKAKLMAMAVYDKGKSAPLFVFTDNSGNIRQSKEFIGKVVYLDIWASWCGPCKAEIPFSKDLVEKYKDRSDIVFLYISIDDKKENWDKSIIEHKLYMGVQGIAYPGGFNSDFAKKYAVQAIPHYVLIDKSGNLIEAKAPRPSQKDRIIPLIDKALGIK